MNYFSIFFVIIFLKINKKRVFINFVMKYFIYKYNYFWKKHVNYYMARNKLFNDGFKMIGHEKIYRYNCRNVFKVSFYNELDDLYCDLQVQFVPGKTDPTKLVGGDVLAVECWSTD